MDEHNEIPSIDERVANLRCSKAHIDRAIKGKLAGISQLPAICVATKLSDAPCLKHGQSPNDTPGQMMRRSANRPPNEKAAESVQLAIGI
jgi:hypothetical protein